MRPIATAALRICIFWLSAFGQQPAKQAKIEKILTLTNTQATIDQMFNQMKGMAASQFPPSATPEERAKAQQITDKIMDLVRERMTWDKMRPEYVKIYDATFSDSEIDGLLVFYQSPTGRAYVEKMPVLLAKSGQIAQKMLGDLMPEIQRIAREAGQK
jgi:hypothetical protein